LIIVSKVKKWVSFQVDESDLLAWKEVAHRRRSTFSGFIRESLAAAARDDPVVAASVVTPVVVAPRRAEVSAAEVVKRLAPAEGECLRRIAKGSFCKSCGRLH
jgi:hypothetical protein